MNWRAELWDTTKEFGGFGLLILAMECRYLPDDMPMSVAVVIGMAVTLVVMFTVFVPICLIWLVCGACRFVYDLARWLFKRSLA